MFDVRAGTVVGLFWGRWGCRMGRSWCQDIVETFGFETRPVGRQAQRVTQTIDFMGIETTAILERARHEARHPQAACGQHLTFTT